MSTIKEPVPPNPLDASLAARLRLEREQRGWSIAELAAHSSVSRAMISKLERGEASPTAALLSRLTGAFGLTLSTLLARAEGDVEGGGRIARATAQRIWRDPETGYVRRAVSPPGAEPELVHVVLPPGARIAYPAASYRYFRGQCMWVLSGVLTFQEAGTTHILSEGDCFALGPPADCVFSNEDPRVACAYLVSLVQR